MDLRKKLVVGVLLGGRSGEHEVSLMSARSVLKALDPEKYTIIQIGITHDGVWLVGENVLEAFEQGNTDKLDQAILLPNPTQHGLYRLRKTLNGDTLEHLIDLDVIFPVLHGTFGEDGTLQGLLELAELAYVGAGVLGSALGMDKGVFKDVMRFHNIPVVDWFVVSRKEVEQDIEAVIERAIELAPFPIFIKPANLGSSVGVSRCMSRADLLEGFLDAARYDRRILVEQGINAREIEVSILGNDEPIASVPGEIIPSREFYTYEAKYIDNKSELLIPAPIPPHVAKQVQELAIRAYRAVDCAGMARVDFLLEKDIPGNTSPPRLFLNELNTIPGFTQISMYPKLWEASGLSYPALIDRLIELAFERKSERDKTERRYRSNT